MIFAITTQPLMTFLEAKCSKGRMIGIQISDSLYLCKRMFADDMDILIPTMNSCFTKVEDTISLYEKTSRAKINLSKSTIIPIGISTIPQ